ncbi:GNAT family N-acetyltransferase [Paenibacillus spongiae]|uniref:GNAT family N-acetyltransferase n=1 Tax=Paenibacillus spongiae TaxID=2909671 RepID=A0ABY5S895_9BACL|nr:GNAT family N-acetyltransferase [Paenibacillus spongiae]UVI29020.1 GNAT family N-acetyltransferase [Paenibacillus spongiae]
METKLEGGFGLLQADPGAFAVHYSTYRENIFFRQSWERRLAIFGDDAPCYWITFRTKRIGGVCLEPNELSSFFLEPPYTDVYQVLTVLKKYLAEISDKGKSIQAYGILPYHAEAFTRAGFVLTEARRVMIRPTEICPPPDWGTAFHIIPPTHEKSEEIAVLFLESYSGEDHIGYPADNTMDQHRSYLTSYFAHNTAGILTDASRLVVDKRNNKLAGVCLISIWEDLPLISNIAVLPEYRGKQIATKLITHALTVLNPSYEVLRLFVTIGNPAESLYTNLGFYSGLEQMTFGWQPVES